MKKALLSIAVITSLGMVACNKENIESTIFDEISSEEESLTLPESDFTITETEPLGDVVDDRYTSGILEYAKNGEVLAVVDYNLQEDEEVSIIKEEGDTSKCDMKKKPRKKIIVL